MLFVYIAVALTGALLTVLAASILALPVLLAAAPLVASALVLLSAVLVAWRSSRRTLVERDARRLASPDPKPRTT